MINQCLTGKTSGHDRPRYPVLQMLWGIITSMNIDYAELMWEESVQAIQTFLTNKANIGSPTKKDRKDKPHVIPYCRLGNLKFVPKGEEDEVFGMPIPNEVISNNIKNIPYYNAYMEMVAKHDQKVAAEKEGKKKALVDEPDEEPAQPEPESEHQGEGEDYDVEQAIQMSLESFQAEGHVYVRVVAIREPVAEATGPLLVVEGKGKAIVTEEQAAQSLLALHTPKRRSTTDQFIFQRRTPSTEEASTGPSTQPQDDTSVNIVCNSPSLADAETGVKSDKTNSGGQAGSDLGKTPESRPPPEQVFMDEDQAGPDHGVSRVAHAGPDPKLTHNEFMANVYPNVHESLKFLADEHVILEDPLSSTGTLSSMKNLV
ncbi:hypothetical protein Tco_1534624, partial [Tanacetum coccineum]